MRYMKFKAFSEQATGLLVLLQVSKYFSDIYYRIEK